MNRTIVRVKTSKYITGGKLRLVKDVYTLKRKSTGGFDMLADEISCVGEDIFINGLIEACDGIYELQIINESYDIESGICDGWELQLVPYFETKA